MMCRHQQAEPVVLSTGELVACVCIWCWEQLPPGYIAGQIELCLKQAYCPHGTFITISAAEGWSWNYCTDCQARDDEFVGYMLAEMTKPLDPRAAAAVVPIILRDIL